MKRVTQYSVVEDLKLHYACDTEDFFKIIKIFTKKIAHEYSWQHGRWTKQLIQINP